MYVQFSMKYIELLSFWSEGVTKNRRYKRVMQGAWPLLASFFPNLLLSQLYYNSS